MPSLALIKSPQLNSSITIIFRDLAPDVAVTVPIGRAVQIGMRIPADDKVSKRHCIVYQEAGVLRVLPLNSKHGTYLNRGKNTPVLLRPGEEYELHVGDILRLGDSFIEVRANTYGTKLDDIQDAQRRDVGARNVNSVQLPRPTREKTR